MHTIMRLLAAYVAQLCRIFQVTPESLTRDRRGNMPPPSGGIGSY
jgi:hypothetical protein